MSPSLPIEVVLPPDVPERERILAIVLRSLKDVKNPWSLVEEASSDPAVLRLWLLGSTERPSAPENTILIGRSGNAWDWVPLPELDQRLPRLLLNLLEVLALREQARTDATTVEVLNEIGRALSAETDRDRLLDELLTRARRLVRADGGSIYLIQQQQLLFVAAQNDTVNFFRTRGALNLDESSLAGWVALNGQPLNIADIRRIPPTAPYRPNLSFDAMSGYITRSMLLVPLTTRQGRILGVLALVNRKPNPGPLRDFHAVLPFGASEVALAGSVASQASVALEAYHLYDSIRRLFDGFVQASVQAIESRDPTTGGHSLRVAELSRSLALEVHDAEAPELAGLRFTSEQITELNYAALLHDFGKVGVREEVLQKGTRLHPMELANTALRFRMVAMQLRQDLAAGRPEATAALAELGRDWALVERLNQPSELASTADLLRLQQLRRRWTLPDRSEPVISARELLRLGAGPGSLDPEERVEIERHVEHTWRFLRTIPWTDALKDVPDLAYAHHERLDGTGYPRKLRGAEISPRARIIAVADIFDALTAGDRPYRKGLDTTAATRILEDEARQGRISSPMVDLFIRRRLWERCDYWAGQRR
ncbi:MAG TPA: HD domain-containing phosphohydrolase [Myxococcota bacterium]|nr:HD domain-containing phosphohydrolase [Myxococcota bacterium]